ncbi:E3 ubiquitin-protein ligase FANCL isoform X1 [Cynara cardunculus var. scolymus]|uniref:E3 ubiquitin-protein ligase FANCL isoform X1 n=2 Tax=Cynara cardunculus var. scolymus TaxID=59895 RepID=UPI000D62756D|nr:E3 ubiquitin-protein ligase FANCL isoform X1 [Cynara cardunculus var. scolymus]XP_024971870.1 E3 ubiquitin-protein ligase FANCL isoform X1 [Cynara cardunculus var. scolymus]
MHLSLICSSFHLIVYAGMNISEKSTECPKLALSSSFSRTVYSEIEEIGWEHLVKLAEDLSFVTFRVIDKKERVHVLEVLLNKSYPNCPPSVSADVPYIFNLEWSTNSRLMDVVKQFRQHLEKLQQFWSTLEDIDQSLWVSDSAQLHRATPFRHINIGNDCSVILLIHASNPRSLPECHFMGSDEKVILLRDKWRRNCKRWMKDKLFTENLANLLEVHLPGPPGVEKNDQQIECGICYSKFLPIDDELGAESGGKTDYTCENSTCSKAFHSVCLRDWLRSITTTRQSFDVLFGSCPYCSEPVAVKIGPRM